VLGARLETSLPPPAEPLISPGALYAEAAKRIRVGEIDEGLAAAADVIFAPGGWELLPEWIKAIYRDNARTLLGQSREQGAPYARADAAITAPTLFVAGERSPETFRRTLDGLETAISDVQRVVIPGAG
jgi:pimeloyl-ACP methyl ester carboxylesterase